MVHGRRRVSQKMRAAAIIPRIPPSIHGVLRRESRPFIHPLAHRLIARRTHAPSHDSEERHSSMWTSTPTVHPHPKRCACFVEAEPSHREPTRI